MEKRKQESIGIDLGSTRLCAGVWKYGTAEIFVNEAGSRTTPAMVLFDTEIRSGEYVPYTSLAKPSNSVSGIKRLLGKKYSQLKEEIDHLPFRVIKMEFDRPGIEVEYLGKLEIFSPETIMSYHIQFLKTLGEDSMGHKVESAVITVPAYFDNAQRQATKCAAEMARLEVKRIINEPTAVAIAYGYNIPNPREKKVVIFDFGGSSLDITLLSIEDGVFEVLATNGDLNLGGKDMDERIANYFAEDFKKRNKIDLKTSARSMGRLKLASERAKKTLAAATQATVEIDCLYGEYDYCGTITRTVFESICSDIFRKAIQYIDKALRDARVEYKSVDDVLLAGGSCQIPKLVQLLTDYFGKAPQHKISPDEVVTIGAAVQAAYLDGRTDKASCHNYYASIPLSLGVETAGGLMTPVIEKFSAMPVKKTITLTTHSDNQSSITIKILEGERLLAKDNCTLGSLQLSLLPAPRGIARILVDFEIEDDGFLHVSVWEKGTKRKESISIKVRDRLTKVEVQAMHEAAEAHMDEDMPRRSHETCKNHYEAYITNIRNTLDDEVASSKFEDEDRVILRSLVDAELEWINSVSPALVDRDVYGHKLKDAEQIVNPIVLNMKRIYLNEVSSQNYNVGDVD